MTKLGKLEFSKVSYEKNMFKSQFYMISKNILKYNANIFTKFVLPPQKI